MKVIIISAVWCPSCLIMKSRFAELEKQYPNVEFVSYDIDLDEEASTYQVGNILPVLLLLDDTETEIARLIGEQKIEEMIKTIESHL